MGLEEVLEACPSLLDACVGGNVAAMKTVSLVSKGARRSALTGHLDSYTIIMLGSADDRAAEAGRVLRGATLSKLQVFVKLTGEKLRMLQVQGLL